MGEKVNLISKKHGETRVHLFSKKQKNESSRSSSPPSPVGQILHLQQTSGNQAVQRLLKTGEIQAKLKIGKPNDKYEMEADRVANKVMSMPEPKGSLVNGHSSSVQCQSNEEEEPIQTKPLADQITPLVQRQAEPEEEEPVQTKLQRQEEEQEEEPVQTKQIQRQEAEEEEEPVQTKLLQRQEAEEEEEPVQTKLQRQEEEEEEPVQAKQARNQAPAVTSTIESGVNSLKGGGQSLSESNRAFFEPRFGADFSHVRVHTDNSAGEMAKSINAKAFTTGSDIVFGAGQYRPKASEGRKLLSHELTHVVQQGFGSLHKTVNRFSYKEHKSVGEIASRGKWVVLYPGGKGLGQYKISYGDMVALAGDYFESIVEMKNLASTASGQRQLEYARYMGGIIKEPTGITETEKKNVKTRYYDLNKKNFHHFTQTTTHDNNLTTYIKGHERAINEAFMAKKSKDGNIDEALLIESFYDHFLTDAFTGGHVTAPRQASEENWIKIYPLFVENFFNHVSEHMAAYINDHNCLAGIFKTVAGLKSMIISQVEALAPPGVSGYSLGGLIAVAVHDWYNKRGLDVVSRVNPEGKSVKGGHKWKAYGEITNLEERKSQVQKDMVIAAVKAGIKDIEDAYKCKTFNCLKKKIGPPYKVEAFVPKADPSSKTNVDFKWKFNNVDDLIRSKEIWAAVKDMLGPGGEIGKLLSAAAKKLPTSEQGTNPQQAFENWLSRFWGSTELVIKEIADYVPGGVRHHATTDDMSRDYIATISKKGRLTDLTTAQMVGLIEKMMRGATANEDEQSILTVLKAANKKGNIYQVVNDVGGFGRFEENFQGKEWHMLLKVLTHKYFRILPLSYKMYYVKWLVVKTKREWGEEACIAILNATTTSEFKEIVKAITREELDSFLDGAEQDRFDELLIIHNI